MIVIECHTCQVRIEEPDSGLGRARIAAWGTHHQGHRTERITR